MSEKKDRNLNITIKNNQKNDEVVFSISSIARQMKRLAVCWLVLAIVAGMVVYSLSAINTFSKKTPAEAVVSFNFDGIERGLNPKKNRKFDVNEMKSPRVIEMALTKMNIDLEKIESIRSNIRFDYKLPQDTYEKLKAYNSVMEKATNGSLTAAQAMLETTYYPTQYSVIFDYGKAGFNRETGAELLNTLLNCYGDYFYKTYGFNEPLGAAVTAVDTTGYDYAQQIDLYKNSLRTIRNYLSALSNEDNSTFRSSVTGYTFNDLSEYAKTISNIDLDRISSYISVNNVTKDKAAAIAYYNYRIENLSRDKDEYEERLGALNASIEKYVKDTATYIGVGVEGVNSEATLHSEQYDTMFKQKTNLESSLAQTKQDIKFYESRRDSLNSEKNSSPENVKRVEADLEQLGVKVADIVDLTEKTANDYYENIQFINAYSVLAPASKSISAGLVDALKDSLKFIIIIEILIFAIYIMVAFFKAIASDNKCTAVADGDDSDEEENDLEDVIEAIEEAAEKTENKPSGKSKKK